MPPTSLSHWQNQASALLSGFLGDWLEARANPLAVPMQLFNHDRALSLDTLATEAGAEHRRTLIILIHGLTELETIWDFPGQPGYNYATALSEPLGATALTLRYNSGRAIYQNGRDLSEMLEQLVGAWPVPVENLVLVGHSMGGLLIRSACHYGAENACGWTERLDSCIYLGSPHDGSWLARLAHGTTDLMQQLPRDYLKAVADLINLRSVGIRNLNQGVVTEGDNETAPLMAGVRHFAVSGLLGRQRNHPVNALIGDALVHEGSACGQGQDDWCLDGTATFPGIHHIRLAHHPRVLAQLEEWLQ
ncbi:esterase/lipase family protein [Marinobacter fonticola]|uniref:esterase/lipase family protein n=1 Tax=Marinobacter fonticola TaxID=2603215 RepID=UPI0011E7A49C|nr:alpha/beta fold hydrolase [Marinobacter fonticola]